ncbi:MAG: MgtC/SapB family protein [Candidatus Micrarchaeota archaeon]
MPLGFLEKLLISAAIGAVIGLEREHTKRQTLIGLRTFSLISLLGMLLTEMSSGYLYLASLVGLVGIFALMIAFYYFRATHIRHALGLTTAIMLPVTYMFGVLVSMGYVLEAIACAVLAAYVLLERREVHRLVELASKREILDGLVFALLAFVVYPLIPSEPYSVFGQEFRAQGFFLTVAIVSAISFISHLILRFVHKHAVLYASFLGGMVSSLATLMLFSKGRKAGFGTLKISFTSSAAGSVLRDFILLAFLNSALLGSSMAVFILPLAGFSLLTYYYSREVDLKKVKMAFPRPISLVFVFEFAAILFLISMALNYFSEIHSELFSLLTFLAAGALNSASVVSSVAFLNAAGSLSAPQSAVAIFLALTGSALGRLVVAGANPVWRQKRELWLFCVACISLAALGLWLSVK